LGEPKLAQIVAAAAEKGKPPFVPTSKDNPTWDIPWAELSDAQRTAAERLGWTGTSWEARAWPLPDTCKWADLTAEIQKQTEDKVDAETREADAEKAIEAATAAKTSCLLQAAETRLQTNHSDATMLDPQNSTLVEFVNFMGNKSDQRFKPTFPKWHAPDGPGEALMIRWAFAIAIVLAGSRTLFQEAQAAGSQVQGGKKRDALWDVTRSALMVLIINFHLQYYQVYYGPAVGDNWFPGFYMPAFFLISGMFSKRRGDSYWSNILVNNVFNACLFAPIYAPLFSPCVGSLWFLWALAVYRALLQPVLAECVGHLGQWIGAGACLLVAVVFNYAVTAIPLWCVAVLQFDQNDLLRIGFHAIFFAIGFAMDAATMRRILQHKITLALSLLHISFLAWVSYGTYFQSKDLRMKLFSEDIPEDFMPLFQPLGWTLTVAQRTLASLSFIALLVPLVDAESSYMRFLCQLFALSGKRTLYGYCLQFICIERLGMTSLQMMIDLQFQEYMPMPFYMLPHQLLQVLFMFSLCSPLAERAFHFMVSPEWVLDCFRGTKASPPASPTK